MINSPPEIAQRQRQLRNELEGRGIIDLRVLDAIETTRRDLFVPASLEHAAYRDDALPIGAGQTISQPYIVALMSQALALAGDETVLEVGTGSGYQTAILARLCHRVVTIERLPELAAGARFVLDMLGVRNVEYHLGDGTLGVPECAPYDGILIAASAPAVPQPLIAQLKAGGRMVLPIGDETSQDLTLVHRTDEGVSLKSLCACRFVKLIGEAGWK